MKLPWDSVNEEARAEWRDHPTTRTFLNSLVIWSQGIAADVTTKIFDNVSGPTLSVLAGSARGLTDAVDLAKAKGPTDESIK